MANFYYSLQRGQETGVGDLVTATTSTTAAADVELRVNTANGIILEEVYMAIEAIENYLLNLGLESQPGVNLPAETING